MSKPNSRHTGTNEETRLNGMMTDLPNLRSGRARSFVYSQFRTNRAVSKLLVCLDDGGEWQQWARNLEQYGTVLQRQMTACPRHLMGTLPAPESLQGLQLIGNQALPQQDHYSPRAILTFSVQVVAPQPLVYSDRVVHVSFVSSL